VESALRGADVFIGLSGSVLPEEALTQMAPGAIAFLLSNPEPELHPDIARKHVAVVATGRSDFPNQINNSLAFPGVFRAALDVRATSITENMKLAAASALADLVGEDATPDYVIPGQFDERVAPAVAAAVAAQARVDGVARRNPPRPGPRPAGRPEPLPQPASLTPQASKPPLPQLRP